MGSWAVVALGVKKYDLKSNRHCPFTGPPVLRLKRVPSHSQTQTSPRRCAPPARERRRRIAPREVAGAAGAAAGAGPQRKGRMGGRAIWWVMVMLAVAVVVGAAAGESRRQKQRDFVSSEGKHIMFVSLAVPSHIRPLNHMASELIGRGYRVSFAIPEEGRKMVNTGITVVSSGPSAVPPKELKHRFRIMSQESTAFRGILTSFNEVLLPSVMPMFKSLKPSIKQSSPDIMVIDIAALAGVMLAEEYDIPYVLNNPSLLFSPGESSATIPAWGSGFGTSMSLADRCLNAVFPRLLSLALIPSFMHLNRIRWDLFLDLYRSQHEVIRHAPILTDTVFGLEYPRPLPPLVKMVGPLLPAKLPQLSNSVTEWIRSAEPPVVLIHLGSMTYLEPWQVKEMLDGFSNDAFRVLWVMNKSQRQAVPYVPASFLIEANVPYLAIVSHPDVIAVVSNCQLDAAQEALYFGKPILCLPFYMDQPDVASRVVDVGAGLTVEKASLSSVVLSHKIWTLISNSSFTEKAGQVRKLLERAGGTQRAADFIQEALEVGTDHWAVVDASRPWHVQLNLDIAAVFAALILLVVIATRLLYSVVLHAWRKAVKHLELTVPAAPAGEHKGGAAARRMDSGTPQQPYREEHAGVGAGDAAGGFPDSLPAAEASSGESLRSGAGSGRAEEEGVQAQQEPASQQSGGGASATVAGGEITAVGAGDEAKPAIYTPASERLRAGSPDLKAAGSTAALDGAGSSGDGAAVASGGDANSHPSSDGLAKRSAVAASSAPVSDAGGD